MQGNSFFGFSGGGGGTPPPTTDSWLLDGNTNGAEKYFGTNDNYSIPIYTNGAAIGIFLNTGDFGFGTVLPTSRVHIKGVDSTSSNYALKADNSATSPLFSVRNDGNIYIGSLLGSYKINMVTDVSNMVLFETSQNLGYVVLNAVTNPTYRLLLNSVYAAEFGQNSSETYIDKNGTLTLGSTNSGGQWTRVIGSGTDIYIGQSAFVKFGYASAACSFIEQDANTPLGIGTFLNQELFFFTNNTRQVTVLGSGNVGFGITIPLGKSHVFGVDATTNVNQRLEPVANVTEDTTGNTIGTTDATANVTAQTIEVPTDKVVSIESTIVYRKTAGAGVGTVGDGTTIKLNSSVKNVSGTLTLDTVQNTYTGTTNAIAGVSATYTISGTNVLVSVTGVVNDNITWNVITKVNTVA